MIDHLADLDADFRVFYRLDPEEVRELTGPQFLDLAVRVSAYQGVMAARIAAVQQRRTEQSGEIESTPEQLQTNSALADVIDYG